MARVKDSEYLFLTVRLRSLENQLLSRERMEQMLEARTMEEALRVLNDCGYHEPEDDSPEGIDALLAEDRQKVSDDLALFLPTSDIVKVFQTKYDYHNTKVLLKAKIAGEKPERLFIPLGEVELRVLRDSLRAADYSTLPEDLAEAIPLARELIATEGNLQRAELLLDRFCFAKMLKVAEDSESSFLVGYVKRLIDTTNLRSAVRTVRLGLDVEFLEEVLLSGGGTDEKRILQTVSAGGSLEEIFDPMMREAVEAGETATRGGSLVRFEKLCDDAVTDYVADARFVAFGDAPVVAYLVAKETEYTAIRILLLGRLAGLPADVIRERLRETYV